MQRHYDITMNERKEALLGKTLDELHTIAVELGLPAFTAKQIAHWLYHKRVRTINEMTNLSLRARTTLAEHYTIGCSAPVDCQHSVDGTIKYLYQTWRGDYIETVFIPDADRATLCVSSQVGCKMACKFCMTGRQGFNGNLSTADILNQIYSLPEYDRLTNIVFMGQGEPLDNVSHVLRTCELMTADYAWAWSPKRITVSTVGGVPRGLIRFLAESKCSLAVSLHNPIPEERLALMPAEAAFPIAKLVETLMQEDFCRKLTRYDDVADGVRQRKLSFEYIVFKGVNDTRRHADALIKLLSGLECKVNLIRFHAIPDTPLEGLEQEGMVAFRDYLTQHGLFTTIRASRGQDIFAACGLLTTAKQQAEKKAAAAS